jgi:hypothetical protein
MKTSLRFLSLALLLIVVTCGVSSAGSTFDVGAGIAVPVGQLNDLWNFSYSANAAYLLELSPFLAAGASAGYHRMSMDQDAMLAVLAAPLGASASGGALTITTLCAELRVKSGAMDRALVYGCVGGGFNFLSLGDITLDGDEPLIRKSDGETRLGGYAGIGFGAPITPRFKLGAEARFNVYSMESNPELDNLDNTGQFWTVRALVVLGL